jgi:glyoxylase-like metal-dependent hydrolase (beta-lactamase superfamily II)
MSDLSELFARERETERYEVFALRYARITDRRIHENFVRRDMHDGPMPLDFYVWIARSPQRMVLIDTGFGRRAATERGRPLDIDPVEALRRIGVEPETLTDVILTHLHYDHAGNISRFPKARIHVQDTEVEFATGRCMCHAAMRYPYDVEDVIDMVRCTFEGRARFHRGVAYPLPGISVHPLPGHTRGMQGVRIDTARGPILLASDCSHYYANFLRDAPFVISVDVAQTLESYERMFALVESVEHIIPGHDPRIAELFPRREIAGVELFALHEAPVDFSVERLATL